MGGLPSEGNLPDDDAPISGCGVPSTSGTEVARKSVTDPNAIHEEPLDATAFLDQDRFNVEVSREIVL